MPHLRLISALLSLLLWCSRAAAESVAPELPADVAMNKEAGHGGHLTVMLRVQSGEEMPFVVDTGAPVTAIDKSLERKLGQRLGTTMIFMPQDKQRSGVYAAPKLYLGSTQLMTGSNIFTYDFRRLATRNLTRPRGILGLDCLRHYCIQLDFSAGKMRFLKSIQLESAELGKAFPLTVEKFQAQLRHDGLIGESTNVLIDTGCNIDGLLKKAAVKRQNSGTFLKNGKEFLIGKAATTVEAVSMQECVWDGETYTNVLVGVTWFPNVLGLGFLARHLVTLDFPNQTMYLKRTSVGPLADDIGIKKSQLREIREFLQSLKDQDKLPGWARDDRSPIYYEAHSNVSLNFGNRKGAMELRNFSSPRPESATFDFHKKSDSSTIHYRVGRASKDSLWNLQRAWRTDQKDYKTDEYPVR